MRLNIAVCYYIGYIGLYREESDSVMETVVLNRVNNNPVVMETDICELEFKHPRRVRQVASQTNMYQYTC